MQLYAAQGTCIIIKEQYLSSNHINYLIFIKPNPDLSRSGHWPLKIQTYINNFLFQINVLKYVLLNKCGCRHSDYYLLQSFNFNRISFSNSIVKNKIISKTFSNSLSFSNIQKP